MPIDSIKMDADKQLMESVKEGDLHSFSLLYDKYAAVLFGIIGKIIYDKKLAEDILTQTFVTAWNQISIFNASSSTLFSWLVALARKTALENQPSGNVVNEAIKTKSINYTAFDLVYYKRLSCIEVARMLNITVDEVKNNIRMTIKYLKENEVAC